jgi:hypothetical protein
MILGVNVHEAEKKTERAEATTYECKLGEACPLLQKRQCILLKFWGDCVYGNKYMERSCTKRSIKYSKEVRNFKEESAKYHLPKAAYDCGIQLIGDYYYLPYSHIDMCKSVPFVRHSVAFSSGIPFVHKDDFTPENIVKLVKFRPCALMGGEITGYQKNSVPEFLLQLKHIFPDLYEAAAVLCPDIREQVIDIDGITQIVTKLTDIPPGCIHGYKVVQWISTPEREALEVLFWDGEVLTLRGKINVMCLNKYNDFDSTYTFKPIIDSVRVFITGKALIAQVVSKNPAAVKDKA